ncbi:hypothetical protein C0J56_17910 [Pseudomonas fluorescens]|nr:hypothetical protein C0J56_17910 [Pseudomonas fluorescens]
MEEQPLHTGATAIQRYWIRVPIRALCATPLSRGDALYGASHPSIQWAIFAVGSFTYRRSTSPASDMTISSSAVVEALQAYDIKMTSIY